MRKIAVFTATRAEYGVLRPVLQKLSILQDCTLQLLVSGTHLVQEQGYTLDEILSDGFSPVACIPFPLKDTTKTSLIPCISVMIAELGKTLAALEPDIFVVLGDRYECLAAAYTASLCMIPIAHISGGDITEGAIDDNFRHAITKLSHLHFTDCEVYRKRVIQLGEQPERVWNVGSTGVENALTLPLLPQKEITSFLKIGEHSPYFLCTFHPVTLEAGQEVGQVKALCEALDAFPQYKIIFTGANADAGGNTINRFLHEYSQAQPDRVQVHRSLGVVRYLSAAKYASCVVGNSSSGILEIPSLGTPVLNIGDRQKGRISSDAVLHCPPSPDDIIQKLTQSLTPEHKEKAQTSPNPYQKNGTSSAICEVLQNYPLEGILKKSFCDI